MLVGTESEMLDGLTGVLGTSDQDDIAAGRVSQSQLVQSQSLTTGLLDPGTSSGGESESSDVQLGDGQESVVVGDGTDDRNRLAFVCLLRTLALCLGHEAGDGDWGSVDARLEQSLEDNFVEVGVGAPCCGRKERSLVSLGSL